MMNEITENTYLIAEQAIDIAIKCVSTGETLIPFVVTKGEPGSVFTLASESFDECLASAQSLVNEFDSNTKAFAFSYDGYITVDEGRFDAIYIEASEISSGKVFMFAQRYKANEGLGTVEIIGSYMFLGNNTPQLVLSGKKA